MASEVIARTLYRSLLRTIKPFTSSKKGPILCSLLYRNGMDDFMVQFPKVEQFEQHMQQHQQHKSMGSRNVESATSSENKFHDVSLEEREDKEEDRNKKKESNIFLSQEEARDLTKTYHELQKLHYQNQQDDEERHQHHDLRNTNTSIQDFVHYTEWLANQNKGNMNTSTQQLPTLHMEQQQKQQPHILLYKHLLRQLFYNEHDKIVKYMNFPSQIINKRPTKEGCDTTPNSSMQYECTMGQKMKQLIQREFRTNTIHYAGTEFHTSSKMKRETGFLVLRELQKKLLWAESMGMQHLFERHNEEIQQDQEQKSSHIIDEDENVDIRNVHALPCHPPSSYLQPGAFLVAHPMMDGIFAKSVICILQHTERKVKRYQDQSRHISNVDNHDNDVNNDNNDNRYSGNETQPEKDDKKDDEKESGIIENIDGGTYGLIINLPVTVGVPNSNSERRRGRTLREVIRHDSLPQGVKEAFGDCPVLNGGPVNFSLQMLRITSQEDEEKLKIGGTVLPTVINESLEINNKVVSTAMYSDNVVYFGGDIIKAAQSVIDGDIDKENFTFFIGASCWETHQLEGEIAKGYWLPFSGPTTMAIYDQDKITKKDAEASNVWLQMMSSLGEEAIANLILKNEDNIRKGDACDDV